MNWRIVFLAILLVSAVGVAIGVTIGVTCKDSEVLTTFSRSLPKVYLDEPDQLRPIDADGPGG